MKILFDIQTLQSGSKDRGIGYYTRCYIKAFKEIKNCEVCLLGNSYYENINKELCIEFEDDYLNGRLLFWKSPGALKYIDDENAYNRKLASLSRAQLVHDIKPDVFYISNMFEGNVDDVLMDIEYKRNDILYVSVLHDLIPLLNKDMYLSDKKNESFYMSQLDQFEKSDFLVAISKSAENEKKELKKNVPSTYQYNGISQELAKLKNIKYPKNYLDKFKIKKDYLLYVGAGDPRKNLISFIEAFGMLESDTQKKFDLVVAGAISDGDQFMLEDAFKKFCSSGNNIIFTGRISDYDLAVLYKEAFLFVFPSIHEGFGLPALEALFFETPVIGSNLTSVPEIIQNPKALFNPMSIDDIHRLIKKAIKEPNYRESLRQRGRDLSIFSYDYSAKNLYDDFVRLLDEKKNIVAQNNDIIYDFLTDSKEKLSSSDLNNILHIIDANEKTLIKSKLITKSINIRIEGPFDSSYSLALVNRETANAIKKLGYKVSLHSTEGPGDYEPSGDFLSANPEINQIYLDSKHDKIDQSLVSRLLYPPRVNDNQGRGRYLHHYAWEESAFPSDWANDFNEHVDGMSVLSNHVKKIMIDSGVYTPIKVSGVGIDHWIKIQAKKYKTEPLNEFKFIHVSSCFDRKGPESLIKGYFSAFNSDDNVSLIIKTFPNPHNKIEEIIESERRNFVNPPHVVLINEDLKDSELKGLLNNADVYVSTTFAEGFGLPFAEAFYSNIPVIATNWSGHLDFLDKDSSYLLDYDFKYAKSHFELFHSVWAEPKISDLIEAFKSMYKSSKSQRDEMSKHGRNVLDKYFTWNRVAKNYIDAIESSCKNFQKANIATISTYNSKCGIATYCDELFNKEINTKEIKVYAPHESDYIESFKEDFVERSWTKGFRNNVGQFDKVLHLINRDEINVLIIQFQHTWYDYNELKSFIKKLNTKNVKVILELHNSSEVDVNEKDFQYTTITNLKDVGPNIDRILVHSANDLNNMKNLGLIDNVALMPHGVKVENFDKFHELDDEKFTISTFGFCLPQKGIIELVQALDMMKQKNINVHLSIYAAIFPDPISEKYASDIKLKIHELNLQDDVVFNTEFREMLDIKKDLASSDIVVYPYQDNNESVSGAVRVGLSIGKSVLVTNIRMFEEFGPSVIRSPSNNPNDISNTLENFLEENPTKQDRFNIGKKLTNQFLAQTDFKTISKRYLNLAQSLINNA